MTTLCNMGDIDGNIKKLLTPSAWVTLMMTTGPPWLRGGSAQAPAVALAVSFPREEGLGFQLFEDGALFAYRSEGPMVDLQLGCRFLFDDDGRFGRDNGVCVMIYFYRTTSSSRPSYNSRYRRKRKRPSTIAYVRLFNVATLLCPCCGVVVEDFLEKTTNISVRDADF